MVVLPESDGGTGGRLHSTEGAPVESAPAVAAKKEETRKRAHAEHRINSSDKLTT
jgi:hypothetical protein